MHAIIEPAQAVQAVAEFFDAIEVALARVAEPRLLAIVELYEDLDSYGKVAARRVWRSRGSPSCAGTWSVAAGE